MRFPLFRFVLLGFAFFRFVSYLASHLFPTTPMMPEHPDILI